MQYLFSALDMAFFTLLYESDLPEVVADPLGNASEKQLTKLQGEFFSRLQKVNLLTIAGDSVVLDSRYQIAVVYCIGFQDEEEFAFQKRLMEIEETATHHTEN
jgi:hypothetical protein